MTKEIGKIRPKRIAVIVKEDGTRETVEVDPSEEFGQLSVPKRPQPTTPASVDAQQRPADKPQKSPKSHS